VRNLHRNEETTFEKSNTRRQKNHQQESESVLTAAVISSDKAGAAALRLGLQQTGLVSSVREWDPTVASHANPGEAIPDVVLLDLPASPEIYFAFAANLRQLRLAVHIIACSSATPEPALLMEAMRSGVQDFLSKPLVAEKLRDALLRISAEKSAEGAAPEKVLVVGGSKGGVGTSTAAVNLGVQIAQITKKRVLLLDFGHPLGHISLLLDLQPKFTLRDAIENLERLDAHLLGGLVTRHQTGLDVLAGAAYSEEWQRLSTATLAGVVAVAQSCFDHLVIDVGVQDPSEWSPVLQSARAILVVAEVSLLSLWTLERYVSAAEKVESLADKLHIVINRWRRVDEPALRNVEQRLRRKVFARLPNDYRQVSDAVTQGTPLTASGSPLSVTYRQLAEDLIKEPAAKAAEARNPLTGTFAPTR
jgi:pilus assembly protein CpaE